ALVKQNRPTRPARPAAAPSATRCAVSAAVARAARIIAGSAKRRARPSIRGSAFDGGLSALRSDGERLTLRSGPTTKVPRKEAEADHGGQRREWPGLDGLDHGVGGAVAHLARHAGQLRGSVLGGVGVLVDEALGRVDRVVDGLAALALDGVDGAIHPVAG